MAITDFLIMDAYGIVIAADSDGDHLAFCCMQCGYPIVAVALDSQRGSDEDHPASCRGCGTQYFLDVRPHAKKLYIHQLDAET